MAEPQAASPSPPLSKGARTRDAILRTAASIASVEGLERLTLGRLANELQMSKSGLYAHFRSKVALQLATIEAAREAFIVEVATPAMSAPEGLRRLRALCEAYFSYLEREVFPGGCFFVTVQAELNACGGPVRDRVSELGQMWLERLEAQVRAAQEVGDLPRGIDPAQLAFELEAIMFIASSTRLLFPTLDILGRARTALRDRLEREVGTSRRSPGGRLRKQ
jgi:AcrR family transcriptional regulator